jgi:hypothetical protein
MRVLGWTLWCAVAAVTLRYWVDVFDSAIRRRGRFTYALLLQVSLLTFALGVTASNIRKANLLWLTPMMFVAGILISPPSGIKQ